MDVMVYERLDEIMEMLYPMLEEEALAMMPKQPKWKKSEDMGGS